MKKCYWKDLGQVNEPGKYFANSVGFVVVFQEDIEVALKIGGNILLELEQSNSVPSKISEFKIKKFTPVEDGHNEFSDLIKSMN